MTNAVARGVLALGAVLSGCGGSDTAAAGGDAGFVAGSGTIGGTLSGRPFNAVAASYLAGRPDDPDRTTVLYVFDAPVTCGELSEAGWDERVADATQALEIKLIGQAVGDYDVTTRPSTGQADVNYTVTSTTGTPSEIGATSGRVHLGTFVAGESAEGTFEFNFPGGTVSGTFTSAICPEAREP